MSLRSSLISSLLRRWDLIGLVFSLFIYSVLYAIKSICSSRKKSRDLWLCVFPSPFHIIGSLPYSYLHLMLIYKRHLIYGLRFIFLNMHVSSPFSPGTRVERSRCGLRSRGWRVLSWCKESELIWVERDGLVVRTREEGLEGRQQIRDWPRNITQSLKNKNFTQGDFHHWNSYVC